MNYQKWLKFQKKFGYNPDQFWYDARMHLWLRTGPFDFLCKAYGVVYETVIGKKYFRLYSYNTHVAGYLQHLTTHVDGKFDTVLKSQSTQDAQMFAHKYKEQNNAGSKSTSES